MVLSNGFCELAQAEVELVDGGELLEIAAAAAGLYGVAVSTMGFVSTGVVKFVSASTVATCSAIVGSPIVAGTALVAGAVAAGYGIYCLFN